MRSLSLSVSLLLLLPLSQALQWPLSLQKLFASPLKVAVVGAGASGSSTAFFLARAAKRLGKDVQIDVYEKEAYVGGRSTVVYPFGDTTLAPIELGASIFVDANKHMVRALSEWNLSTVPFDDAEYVGIWDGDEFAVIMHSDKPTWWDTAKLVYRYGLLAPVRTQRLVKALISNLNALYTSPLPPFPTVDALSAALGFTPYTASDAKTYLASKGIRGLFPEELMDGATRVNYAQSIDEIHALGALVSMAANGANSVQGGNWQVFDHMLKDSGAKVRLNTTVAEVNPKGDSWQVLTSSGTKASYDHVVLAAPLHLSPYTLPSNLSSSVPQAPYVHLHVTLLVTSTPGAKPEFFNLPPETALPDMILTTSKKGREAVKAFNSLSYHGATAGGWVCKIFSMQPLSDAWLDAAFGSSNILWTYRKEWDAYPYLLPTPAEPSPYAPMQLGKGLWYTSGWEPWVSTMETQSLAGRNVAELIVEGAWGGEERSCAEGKMRGWDC
ncbi:FAD/NAD(P)-binding domain-containing protein [Calocera cornea HHB12733]|uniref:FAD/NAD(P)-binding domain-containing protein n=1 Tax=Calocera cornea HHB12733 TaxID=1353952 RepID=A0A165F1Z9_9BASI|nr:FAD/NAD(P)-binding domain-containing protein [Calocera cornea HHB12733]